MKTIITPILTALTLFVLLSNSYGDNYKSITLTSESTNATQLTSAFDEIKSLIENSKIWKSEEQWNRENEIPQIEPEDELKLVFMSSLTNRKDILSVRKTEYNKISVSAVIDNKDEYQTNEVEENLRMIEDILKKHFPNTTTSTKEFKKDLLAKNSF
mgnify:CR=1 FL=1